MAKIVGIIGLGIMGGTTARNLLDTNATRCAEPAGDEMTMAASVAAMAQHAETLITSLPSPGAGHRPCIGRQRAVPAPEIVRGLANAFVEAADNTPERFRDLVRQQIVDFRVLAQRVSISLD